MKKMFLPILVFALLTYCLPLLGLATEPISQMLFRREPPVPLLQPGQPPDALAQPAPTADPAAPSPADDGMILLQNASDGSRMEIPVLEYLIGAVASEVPVSWPDEALKAQAVACHSYVLYQRDHADRERLGGAWLAVDPARRQGFMTREVLQSYWGEGFESNWNRLAELFQPLEHQLLLWKGQPAAACYHAISCGHTEASEKVWRESLPYLCGVDSAVDLAAEGYLQTVTYTVQQMYDALTVNFAGVDLSGNPSEWFGPVTYTDAGYVDTVRCKDSFLRGCDLRQVLGLRSACFTFSYTDDVFVVTTRGYGHGVGLSQWGAKALADAGFTYDQILTRYFPGTELSA